MPPAPLPANDAERLAALRDIGILDTPATEVFDSFVRIARGIFESPIGAVSFVDEERQWFKAIGGLSVNQTPRDWSFCAHAILQPDEVFCIPDAQRDPRFADNPLVLGEPHIRFYAGAPLIDENGLPLGTVCVIDRRPRTPSSAVLNHLRDVAIGVSAAVRLHGALRRLDTEASCDPLTGLTNRRGFEAAMADLNGKQGTLFLLDLDNFKAVNDQFGHPAGDAVLCEVARRLKRVGRTTDSTFRLGGDEFALIAHGLREPSAVEILTGIIRAEMTAPFIWERHIVPMGASVGSATTSFDAPSSAGLVQVADRALYDTKRLGRGAPQFERVPV